MIACASQAAISEGSTREQALAELGAPTGSIVMGAREVLYYDRGTVELRDGKVVRTDLVTPEEARKRREAEARAYQSWLRAEAERAARRKAQGEQELKRMLNEADFLLEDPERQVEIWQDFMRKYPDIPVGAHLLDAQRRADEARERRETAVRLASLEQRTADAEARARAAEDEAARLRYETSRYYSVGWFDPYFGYRPRSYDASVYPDRNISIRTRPRGSANEWLPGANEFRRSPTNLPKAKPDKSHEKSSHAGVGVNVVF